MVDHPPKDFDDPEPFGYDMGSHERAHLNAELEHAKQLATRYQCALSDILDIEASPYDGLIEVRQIARKALRQ